MIMPNVAIAFEGFIDAWTKQVKENWFKQFGNFDFFKELSYTEGKRYIKVVQEGSVVAFIDKNTGDIYKAASWRGPAKHVRGNVLSDQNGMEATSPHQWIFTINYLK